jgi:Tfp pilus assembly protein PilF
MKKILGILLAICMVATLTGVGNAGDKGTVPPIKTAPGSKAEKHNNEGLKYYNQGRWNVAREHFEEAVKADPKSAEAHYNLGVVLDHMDDHENAAIHFTHAFDLGKDNPAIRNSGILKEHKK